MIPTRGYAVQGPEAPFQPFDFERREVGPDDVLIEILYCGICHSDIHQARSEWGRSMYPMVPGHEITGRVVRTGANVDEFKPGDAAGVGCFVDSCRTCFSCREGDEQYCEVHTAYTYNNTEMDLKTPTYGGYSSRIVVDRRYVLRIPASLPLERAAPLLCAGVTTFAPLRQASVGRGSRVAIAGLGGLGHMGVKLAAALGAEVTVLSTAASKEADALRLGAHAFDLVSSPARAAALANRFDLVLDCISAPHDMDMYLSMLRRDGTLVLVGIPDKPISLRAFSLISRRRRITGSSIGSVREMQQVLDFCAEKGIAADVEVIPVREVENAYARIVRGDVRYRFVLDLKTL